MCKLKSAIILKDKIFMPDYDSHSKMLEELGITDDYINASKVFVGAELSPANGDVFSDIDGWKFNVDQDITPEWFDAKDCAERMREAVKEWAKTHIFIERDGLKISHGENIYVKNCKDVEVCGSATVKYICGSATVKYIYDSATVEYIYDSATVECICDSATVKYLCGSATVKYIYGSATVKYICDSATVKYLCGSATVERIYDSATVKYICDSATVKYIYDSATVEFVYNNATVNNIYSNATVKNVCDNATVKYICDNATVTSHSKWNNSATLVIADNAMFKDYYAKVIYHAGGWKLVEVKKGK